MNLHLDPYLEALLQRVSTLTKELFTEFKIRLGVPCLCQSGPPSRKFEIPFEVSWIAFMGSVGSKSVRLRVTQRPGGLERE